MSFCHKISFFCFTSYSNHMSVYLWYFILWILLDQIVCVEKSLVYTISLQRYRDYTIWVCGKNSIPLLYNCCFLKTALCMYKYLHGIKGSVREKWKGKNNRFWSLLIFLLSVASIMRKLLKTSHTEERRFLTNSESCNIRLGS